VFPGIGAYAIYAWAQRQLGASKVGLALYLSPLWGALVSWGILGEPLGWYHLIGALLILPGVALAQSSHR
jgi:drug/metabolite transporter (DMT)-like permease